jgi:hypothetical protein
MSRAAERGTDKRAGHVLVLFALLLPALCGLLGLAIDAGLLFAGHRQAQTLADGAALAGGRAILRGGCPGDAGTAASSFAAQNSGSPDATVEVNAPPRTGPYAGDPHYVEVVVTLPVSTWFVQGLGHTPRVSARAVAGVEPVAGPDVLAALSSTAAPGLSIQQTSVAVGGTIAVDSEGAGTDQNGAAIALGLAGPAVSTAQATVQAVAVAVVGGVDSPGAFLPAPGNTGSPLNAGGLPRGDPLLHLPAPTLAGQTASVQDLSVTLSGTDNVTVFPGVYRSIEVIGAGTGTVTFQPGVYILTGGNASGHALHIDTAATVQAAGVLFYNTGSNYDPSQGTPDSADTDTSLDPGASFGDVFLSAGRLLLTPWSDPSSPFDGLAYYQRRANPAAVTIQSNSPQDILAGTLYAPRAALTVKAGPAPLQVQLIAGSLQIQGQPTGAAVLFAAPSQVARANQVFLVE